MIPEYNMPHKYKKFYVRVLCLLTLLAGAINAGPRVRGLQERSAQKALTHRKKTDTLLLWAQSAIGTRWVVRTDTGFIMTDTARGKKSKIKEEELTLTIERRSFCINGKRIAAKNITIESTNGIVSVNGVVYKGMVVLRRGRRNTLAVIGTSEYTDASSESSDSQSLETKFAAAQAGDAKKEIAQIREQDRQVPEAYHCHIKVLLDQLADAGDQTGTQEWRFKAPQGFIVWDAHYKRKMEVDQLVVSRKNQHIYLNNKICDNSRDNNRQDSLRDSAGNNTKQDSTKQDRAKQNSVIIAHIIPCLRSGDNSGHPTCNGKTYSGFFSIIKNKEKFYLVNSVELEDYICGVLGTESLPGWPLEMQKVCAIACRTYALAMALRADRQGTFYHIKNTNAHQTYEGSHSNALLHKAVNDTRGIFMAYNNEPVLAMYDVCCGGVIPAHIRGFNCTGAPYLARKYACTHCKPCKVYNWQTTWRLKDFEELISKKHKKISDIKSITITQKDRAGIVREIVLKSNNKRVVISGKKLYSIMKGIKSFNFKIQKKGNGVIINGYGYGHHKGLCQWGAREMVRKGSGHEAVLLFYYPGVTFARMA